MKRSHDSHVSTSPRLEDYIKNTSDEHESNKKRVKRINLEEGKNHKQNAELESNIESKKQSFGLVSYE
jgi:hypothetical protein